MGSVLPVTDYGELANGIDDVRETLREMVAGLVADGFTDEQARTIIAGVFARKTTPPE